MNDPLEESNKIKSRALTTAIRWICFWLLKLIEIPTGSVCRTLEHDLTWNIFSRNFRQQILKFTWIILENYFVQQ